ncbi:xanthine dehydrogenase family protein molybdopterin-binding subunit [Pseudorhodoferax sp.]|uniref:xanthine dehydrogenase family protein molybdopterin-binding subunit n=1 Tax=Pseudorhodoferax sp. TaxID=1993553 RepID=UPI002DD6A3A8|nr:molybdopterin cofactor-binding domain-containing protein [Pseudorhodoferax sp.]
MKRRLLVSALAAGPALLLGWGLLPPRDRIGGSSSLAPLAGHVALNGWLRVGAGDEVSLVMPHCEMGQGVHTALAMLVAEELRLPLARVRLETPSRDSRYGNVTAAVDSVLYFSPEDSEPGTRSHAHRASHWLLSKAVRELGIVATGGSSSVADLYPVLREAAATARQQLLGAASLRWRLPLAELALADGVVSHGSGPRATLAELAQQAAATPPGDVQPRGPAEWTLLGTPAARSDSLAKVTGRAHYGIDVRPPGLLHAVLVQGPALGSRPGAFDADALLARPGVLRLVRLPALAGAAPALAVVARQTWPALQAARWLAGEPGHWQPAPGAAGRLDSQAIRLSLQHAAHAAAEGRAGFVFRRQGDADEGLAAAADGGRLVEARYDVPYLAHATLEPMNCTAQVEGGQVRLWAPTQVPTLARAVAARVAGVDEDAVDLQVPYLGGGFGRRLEVDFIAQAVRVALETGGAPVQLLWSREQDSQHDFYRPAASVLMRARLGRDGRPHALVVGSAGDAVLPRYYARVLPQLSTRFDLPDKTTAEGLFSLPYAVPHLRVQHVATRHGVPVGSWRSVGHSHNAFFAESFIDELAHAAGADPLAWRLARLQALPRHAAVLRLVADKAGWGRPLPAGRAHGLALHESFGTRVAMVVEASLGAGATPRVHRIVAAVDCGLVLNPNIARQQIESGVLFGLGAALHGRIDIVQGVVQQANFDRLRLLRLHETPVIETHFVASDDAPTGLGEPGTPPVAPALANALFVLTGVRRRELPLVA